MNSLIFTELMKMYFRRFWDAVYDVANISWKIFVVRRDAASQATQYEVALARWHNYSSDACRYMCVMHAPFIERDVFVNKIYIQTCIHRVCVDKTRNVYIRFNRRKIHPNGVSHKMFTKILQYYVTRIDTRIELLCIYSCSNGISVDKASHSARTSTNLVEYTYTQLMLPPPRCWCRHPPQ